MDKDSISTESMHRFDRTLKLNELCMYIETLPPLRSSLT